MKVIDSRHNSQFKELLKLKQLKYRRQQGLFLAEGPRLVRDGMEAGWRPVQLIMASDSEFVPAPGCPVLVVSPQLLAHLGETESSQGIIAVFATPSRNLAELSKELGLYMVLDGLQDPGNAGALLRSAAAAGLDGVIALAGTVDLTNGKVVRSSMGGIFRVPWVAGVSRGEFIDWVQSTKLKMLKLAPRGGEPFHQVSYLGGIVLALGSEASGLSFELESASSEVVTIPMPGGSESLNAAIAATLVLWQALIARGL